MFCDVFSLITPANGLEQAAIEKSQQMQKELDEIDILISQISSAIRAGNTELAYAYEEQVRNMGVDVVASDYAEVALAEFGMDEISVASGDEVDLPEDTETIHWYKYSVTGYYNYRTGGNFDLVSITAVYWGGTEPLLHYSSLTYKNSQYKAYTKSFIENSAEALVTYGIEQIPMMGTVLTVSDIAAKAAEESQEYITVEIPTDSLSVVFSADRTIRFWYVRTNGSGTGYGLWYVEDKIIADIGCTLTFSFIGEDGRTESSMLQASLLDKEIKQSTYADMTRPCEACQTRVFTKNAVGDILISLAGESVIIDGMYLPVDPGQLQ